VRSFARGPQGQSSRRDRTTHSPGFQSGVRCARGGVVPKGPHDRAGWLGSFDPSGMNIAGGTANPELKFGAMCHGIPHGMPGRVPICAGCGVCGHLRGMRACGHLRGMRGLWSFARGCGRLSPFGRRCEGQSSRRDRTTHSPGFQSGESWASARDPSQRDRTTHSPGFQSGESWASARDPSRRDRMTHSPGFQSGVRCAAGYLDSFDPFGKNIAGWDC
jgi:hypothetical protein